MWQSPFLGGHGDGSPVSFIISFFHCFLRLQGDRRPVPVSPTSLFSESVMKKKPE